MVLIRARVHPFPSRTRKLSSLLLTILGWRRPGKIGSANTEPRDESRGVLSCPEKCSSGCLRHHPVTGQLSSLLLTILGWRRPGKIGSANTKPHDESRGVLSCPEECSSGRLRHHPGTGQLSLLLLTILGWRRPGKIGSANTKPRDESRGVLLCRKSEFGMPAAPSRDRSMGGTMPVAYERAGGRTA